MHGDWFTSATIVSATSPLVMPSMHSKTLLSVAGAQSSSCDASLESLDTNV